MSADAAPTECDDALARLAAVIDARGAAPTPTTSYVARLFAKGDGRDAEEDRRGGDRGGDGLQGRRPGERIVAEVADLWFHSMLALARYGLTPADVLAELERREGLSGLEEFAPRKAQQTRQAEGP